MKIKSILKHRKLLVLGIALASLVLAKRPFLDYLEFQKTDQVIVRNKTDVEIDKLTLGFGYGGEDKILTFQNIGVGDEQWQRGDQNWGRRDSSRILRIEGRDKLGRRIGPSTDGGSYFISTLGEGERLYVEVWKQRKRKSGTYEIIVDN